MAIREDEHWLTLVDAFAAAAVDSRQESWLDALRGLADATGGCGAELVGIGDRATSMFNLMTDFPDEARTEFFDMCGYSPAVNPKVAAGLQAGELVTVAEADYEAVRPLLRSNIFFDWAERYELPFGCQTSLIKRPDRLIGLAVMRNRRQGPTSAEDRLSFAALSPHVRTAVRMRLLLDDQAVLLLAGALEALSIAAFVCDADGRVQAYSEPAEVLMQKSDLLQVREGRLTSPSAANSLALENALRRAVQPPIPGKAPPSSSLVLRSDDECTAPLVLDVFSLPQRLEFFGGRPRIVVSARGSLARPDSVEVLQLAYGLTPGEAFIAQELARGRTREAIAGLRGVSLGTVRIQLKSIFSKLNIHREAELTSMITPLI